MQSLLGAGEVRTSFIRLIADRDQVVEGLSQIAIEHLTGLPRDIDAQLRHDGYCFRMDASRFRPGAVHLERVAGMCRGKPCAIWDLADLCVHRNSTRSISGLRTSR